MNSKLPLHTRDSKLFNASGSLSSDMGGSNNTTGGGQNGLNKPNHYFNLVQLFMKQRSISNERMSICMDQSSECWGASNSEADSGESYANDNAYRQNSPDVKILNTNNRMVAIHNNTNNIGENESKVLSKNTTIKSIFNENNLTQPNSKESKHLFNVNNNNSFEHIACNNHKNRFGKLYNASGSVSSNGSMLQLSYSSSEGTQVTKIPQINYLSKISNRAQCRTTAIDCSVQTSFLANSLRRHCDKSSQISDFMKVIEPSFLSKLKNNDKQIPIYVIYPSYTLPNLNFLHTNNDSNKLLLYPQKYRKFSQAEKNISFANRRPFSCNDVEALRKTGFSHIRDWDSLTMLLPCEYRKILIDIPELSEQMKDKKEELLKAEEKPLFCVSPPTRHRQRPVSCDGNVLMGNHATTVSSSSSTATQPSSGYRGSSTILTDSSLQNSPLCNMNINPSFVYHYENNSSNEALHEHHRHIAAIHENMPDISEASPPRPPLPRGLNRNQSNTKYPSIIQKRSSACDIIPDNIEYSNLDKMSKRISLDDPYQLLKQYQENSKESRCNNSLITNVRRQKKYAESLNYLQYLAINSKNECYKDPEIAENDLNNLSKKTFAHLKSNDLTVNHLKSGHLETPPNSPNVSAIVNRLSYVSI